MSANFVVIGLGSNLDRPLIQLRKALAELKKMAKLTVLKVSSIYESEAQVPKNAPSLWERRFLNAAVLVRVEGLSPQDLLKNLKDIETRLGRLSSETWAPRLIDLDILYWHGLTFQENNLKIPHPSLSERPFALLPLLQIFPEAEISKPLWAETWVQYKPYQTVKSEKYFWPRMMGILNLTLDSFSDGGLYFQEEKLQAQIQKLVEDGAEILDFGAESTRPMASPVDAATEWKHLQMGLEALQKLNLSVLVSVDSYKSTVIRQAIEKHKIDYINDVKGLCNPEMQQVARETGLKTFVMHSLTVPPDPSVVISDETDPAVLLTQWWKQKMQVLIEAGCGKEQFIFDPGIGFGKTKSQSLSLLQNLQNFSGIAEDIMIGHSRKSYQTLFSNRKSSDRDLETAIDTSRLNMAYTQYLRVHDVASTVIALRSQV